MAGGGSAGTSSWGTFFFCSFLVALSGEQEPLGEKGLRQTPVQLIPLDTQLANCIMTEVGNNLWRSPGTLRAVSPPWCDPVPSLGLGAVPLCPPQPALTFLRLVLFLSQHLRLPQLQLLICIIFNASKGVLGMGSSR